MEKLELKLKLKKETRYDLIAETAKKLGKSTGQLLGLTSGWTHQSIDNVVRAAEKLSLDKGYPFSQAFWAYFNDIKKQLK